MTLDPRRTPCPTCGCQGHGQTYQVRCTTCGQDKWPTLPTPPGPGYVCRLCEVAGAERRAVRAAAAAKAAETKRQRGSTTSQESRGRVLTRGAKGE